MTVVQWDRVGKGNLKENLEPSKGLEGNLKEICREKSFDVAQRLSSRCVLSSTMIDLEYKSYCQERDHIMPIEYRPR